MIPTALGWIGQALFLSRFLVQWRASERAGKSVAPASFWWLSLGGALLLGSYTIASHEPVLAGGYLASAWIHARNLRLAHAPPARGAAPHAAEIALVVCILALSWVEGGRTLHGARGAAPWLFVSVVGQALWSSRFLVQWIASERAGRAHFPAAFWWLSLLGNALLLAYALHREDALLVCAFALGPFVQVRNLMLGRAPADAAPAPVASLAGESAGAR